MQYVSNQQYNSNYKYDSLKQLQKLSSPIVGFCAWSKHGSIISSLCGCFSKPIHFKPLSTTLSSTFITLNPDADADPDPDLPDMNSTEDVIDKNNVEINQQSTSESDFRRYYCCNDQSKL
ncbi:hypothetical protein ACH3XW_0550 [Acanthocheilonema viteae]